MLVPLRARPRSFKSARAREPIGCASTVGPSGLAFSGRGITPRRMEQLPGLDESKLINRRPIARIAPEGRLRYLWSMLASVSTASCNWLCSGREIFPAMLEAIERAQRAVRLESYI